MEKVLSGIDRTKNFIGKTVKKQNPNIILDFLKNKGKTIGVKDTKEINNNKKTSNKWIYLEYNRFFI